MYRSAQLEDYRRSLAEYDEILKQFEDQYGMDSAYANSEFEAGRLGDAMDYFEWTGIYALRESVLKRMAQIEAVA
ncbi:MAG: hypothetical protein KJZ86_05470 [Caldilineaceae bacterium]|nr:hypothetical protein [Caldilineaceae bacterium]